VRYNDVKHKIDHLYFFFLFSSTTYGPAAVVLDIETYNDIGKYIKDFRPTHDTEFVFTSWLGKQLDSNAVTTALTEELAYGGCLIIHVRSVELCCCSFLNKVGSSVLAHYFLFNLLEFGLTALLN